MEIALSIVFFIVLLIFTPIRSKMRFYASDVEESLSASVKVGKFFPTIIIAYRGGKLLLANGDVNKYTRKINIKDIKVDLTLKDVKDLSSLIPINYLEFLMYFGYKDNAMTTSLILKSADMIISIIESISRVPKGKFKKSFIPDFNDNKIFIEMELGFSLAFFVIILTFIKILKNKRSKYEYE